MASSSKTYKTSDGATVRVDRGSDGKISMTVVNGGSSGYQSGSTFTGDKSTGTITETRSDGSSRTGTVSGMKGNNPKGSSISWGDYSGGTQTNTPTTPDFGNLKFGQGTSDTDQAARNKELASFYAGQGGATADQIRKDLMKNAGFASASAQDQANTIDKILRMTNANMASSGGVNFGGLQFGQGTSDADQASRNEQLANFYAGQGDYSYDSIYNDLMKNAGFANASEADRRNTVNKILNAANGVSGGTNGMKFGSDAYADTNYDIDSRNQTLANIVNERGYDTNEKIYDWLENSSEAFKNASQADKDNTVKKLMALSKFGVDSLKTEPDEDEIAEETKDEEEDIEEQYQEDDPYIQELENHIRQLEAMYERMQQQYDERMEYYKKNPNEDTLNMAEEETPEVSLNNLSYAYNQGDVGNGAPEQVNGISTAVPYLTPESNIRVDRTNPGDNQVVTEAGLVNNPIKPKFAVYNVDTPEGIVTAANDALTNIMNGQYGGDMGQQAFNTYLLASNRIKNYAAQNGIQEGTPEYTNLFRGLMNHPIWNNLVTNSQFKGETETTTE